MLPTPVNSTGILQSPFTNYISPRMLKGAEADIEDRLDYRLNDARHSTFGARGEETKPFWTQVSKSKVCMICFLLGFRDLSFARLCVRQLGTGDKSGVSVGTVLQVEKEA